MATHSSTLAWKIPWMEEPGMLQSMGSLRVGHDWATSLSLFTFMHCRRKWQPTPVFLPGESQGWGSLVGYHLWGRIVGQNWSDLAAAEPSVVHDVTNIPLVSSFPGTPTYTDILLILEYEIQPLFQPLKPSSILSEQLFPICFSKTIHSFIFFIH